ncbi:unnamed protein product, partial [Candidula unifasciata]
LPMGEVSLNCGSVYDFGCCIGKIALEPTSYLFRTIKLATSYLNVSEIAAKLDDHFPTMTFYDPKITLDDYRTLKLSEKNELTSMFGHYQTLPQWDRTTTYALYPTWRSFEQWIADSAKDLLCVLRFVNEKVFNTDTFDSTEALCTSRRRDLESDKRNQGARHEQSRGESDTMYSQLLYRIKQLSLRGSAAERDEIDSAAGTAMK